MAMHNELWFPSVIWSAIINNVDNIALKKYAYERQKEDEGRKISNAGGWQSNDIPAGACPEVDNLVKTLNNELVEICNQTALNPVQIYNIWININPPGSFNLAHHHMGAMFSGVYYVDADPQQCNIIFERGDNAEYHVRPHNIQKVNYYNSQSCTYAAKTGALYIFPSWLKHHVQANRANKDRISISFNYGEPFQV